MADLEGALRIMTQLDVNIGVLTEAKITDERYTLLHFGHTTLAHEGKSAHEGVVILFLFPPDTTQQRDIKNSHQVLHNMIAATLISDMDKWFLIGTYLAPKADPAMNDINATTKHPAFPVIILGDINAKINNPTTEWDTEQATLRSDTHTGGR